MISSLVHNTSVVLQVHENRNVRPSLLHYNYMEFYF